MKKTTLYILLLSLFFAMACEKDTPFMRGLVGVPTAYVADIQYVEHNGNTLLLQVDIAVVTHRDYDYSYLDDTAFKIQDNLIYDFTIDSIEHIERNGNVAYTSMLMIDQSGSYNDYDPFNQRLRAVNKFLGEINEISNANCGLAHYYRDTSERDYFILLNEGNPFTVAYHENLIQQFWSTYYVQNTSNMYDAVFSTFTFFDMYANNQNNSVTIFAHDLDDGLGMSYNALIDSAVNHNIKINIISIGDYTPIFADITGATGGFLSIIDARSIAESMDKGTPMLASLHRILSEETFVYRLHIKVERNTGSFYPGVLIRHLLKVEQFNSDNEEIVYNPLYLYYKFPEE